MGPSSPTVHGVGVRSARSGAALFYGGGGGNAQRHIGTLQKYDVQINLANSGTQLNSSSTSLGRGSLANPLPSVASSLVRFVHTWILRYRFNIQL